MDTRRRRLCLWLAVAGLLALPIVPVPSSLGASARLPWLLLAGLGCAVALGVALGVFLHRSFTHTVSPRLRIETGQGPPRCPVCGKAMDEGYLPILAGLHWRARGAPIGLPHALGGLPGTVGWRGRPCLHAWRREPCEIVIFRYGR